MDARVWAGLPDDLLLGDDEVAVSCVIIAL
jgi:hypothetical protein